MTPLARHLALTAALYTLVHALPLRAIRVTGEDPGIWMAGAVGLVMIVAAPAGGRTWTALTTMGANVLAHLLAGVHAPVQVLLDVLVRAIPDWGGALLLVRAAGERPVLERSGPLLRVTALVLLVIAPLAALLGAAALAVQGLVPFGPAFVRWYVPEVVTTILCVPAVAVLLDLPKRLAEASWAALSFGAAALGGGIVLVALVVNHPTVAGVTIPISVPILAALLLVAYRFGAGVTAWTAVVLAAVVIAFSAQGVGPLAANRPPGFARNVVALLYVGALGIALTILAAVLADAREAAGRFQAYLDATDASIVAADGDLRVVGYSEEAQRLFSRFARAPLRLGADLLTDYPGLAEFARAREQGWRRAIAGEPSTILVEQGPDQRVEIRFEPLRDPRGHVVGAVSLGTDLARREREDRERTRASRFGAIGRLAGGVAHDINNLMTVILGQTFLLRTDLPVTAASAEALDEIESTVDRTRRLTSQLLAFARAQVVAPRVIALRAAVDHTMSLLRRVVEEHTRCEVEHTGEDWAVRIDPSQFEQVLLNLAANARDAMPQGGRFTIRTGSERLGPGRADDLGVAEGEYATLEVTDTGSGMPADVLERLFEPFFSTKGAKGTGLGLATVQSIVREIGGAVSAASAIGLGTTIRLWLPRSTEPLPEPEAPRVPVARGGRAGVVVCEDEPSIRRSVVRTLTGAGYACHEAATPQDALAYLAGEGRETALLVTDLVMPGMSGVELARRAREMNPALAVLVMTGYADDAARDALAPDVATDVATVVLAKPFSGQQLLETVAELVAPA